MIHKRPVQRMVLVTRLDQHLTRQICAAGASRDLLQLRESPLARPVIARKQTAVGVEHGGERQSLEVVALGEELRTDEDIGVRRALEQVLELASGAYCVAIQTQDAGVRKFFCERD